VLLKNAAGLLPLDRQNVRSVAVVGPLATPSCRTGTRARRPTRSRAAGHRARGEAHRPASARLASPGSGDMGDAALRVARGKDAVVVCVGNHPEGNAGWEVVTSPSEGKEAVDRKAIVLQPDQEEFVRRLYEVNPNTIVCSSRTSRMRCHGRRECLDDPPHDPREPGTGHRAWRRAVRRLQSRRQADADVASLARPAPEMMDYDIRHGRTYMYFRGEPQFPFGHGLSYTTFAFANVAVSRPSIALPGELTVSVDVANTGARNGDEVVQVYGRFIGSRRWNARRRSSWALFA